MDLFYKAKEIGMELESIAIKNLCYYGEYYFFETETELADTEIATDAEFQQAINSIVHNSSEPQLTETEQAILDTAINVDYLVCMKELEI
jgi:hypothetical protein